MTFSRRQVVAPRVLDLNAVVKIRFPELVPPLGWTAPVVVTMRCRLANGADERCRRVFTRSTSSGCLWLSTSAVVGMTCPAA